MVGRLCAAEEANNPVIDKKYFWRVYDRLKNQVMFILDGKDITQANWIRHVQPAFQGENQNLVAYQEGEQIFFLTVRQIQQDEELFVWYSYDFAKRIQVRTYAEKAEETKPVTIRQQTYNSVVNYVQQQPIDVSKFQKMPKYSKKFLNIQEHSETFKNIQK